MVQNPRSPLVFSFAAPPDPGVAEAIASVPGVEVVVHPGLRGPELADAARGADVLIVRSWQRATREVLAAGAGRLAAVVQASAGLDNIDHDAAAELGVRVVGVDPGNATSVAELTLLSLLALFRNVRGYWAGGGVAAWPDRETLRDREIRRKTLGLVGLGRVGSRVARRAAAFEMRVLAYDPYLADADFAARGAERIRSLDEMLPLLDALSLHCPLTDETRGMIDAR
ncbi:MAG TPA: NAD(P)-dependent oxidoreductase, partial [Acidobacteriota bacterium]|nr:NAD(P)-dependent oxidoreductase [Acidobacteriota bacterium]